MSNFFESLLIWIARIVIIISIIAVIYCIFSTILKIIGVLFLGWNVILIPGLIGGLIVLITFIAFIKDLANNS